MKNPSCILSAKFRWEEPSEIAEIANLIRAFSDAQEIFEEIKLRKFLEDNGCQNFQVRYVRDSHEWRIWGLTASQAMEAKLLWN